MKKPTSADVLVTKVFDSLRAIFPAWRQAFANDADIANTKREWLTGLLEAGITDVGMIKAGLSKARRAKSPFIPSVGQFIDWCQSAQREALGMPSEDAAYAQVSHYVIKAKHRAPNEDPPFIHPAVYWAYQNIDDIPNWKLMKTELHRETFINKYRIAQEKAVQGFDFPKPPVLLVDYSDRFKQPTPEEKLAAERARAQLKSLWGKS